MTKTKEEATIPLPLEVLKLQYQQLHTNFGGAIDQYLKGTTTSLVFFGVSLGYVLQSHLNALYSRLICVGILAGFLFWYLGSISTLRLYQSLTNDIQETTHTLGLEYKERNYKTFKIVVLGAMGTLFPFMLFVFYLLISPPKP